MHRRARFVGMGGGGPALPVMTQDLCSDGISVICPQPLAENQLCELVVSANCEGMPTELKVCGRAIYFILSGMRSFRAGIAFTRIAEIDRTLIARVLSRSIPL